MELVSLEAMSKHSRDGNVTGKAITDADCTWPLWLLSTFGSEMTGSVYGWSTVDVVYMDGSTALHSLPLSASRQMGKKQTG